jgi:2-polyprenyl-6-methoxyphenol hydroxylase-like FAD-dependent oxidoreductase
MCPVCVASTAVMVAGAGSAGGILALCIARFKKIAPGDWSCALPEKWSHFVSEKRGESIWHPIKRLANRQKVRTI